MEKWVEIRKSGDFAKMSREIGVSPVIARILRNRDLITPQEIKSYLSPELGSLNDPMMLDGMDRVIFVLKEKIEQGRSIRIIGDYDVDGICSTYILFKALSYMGASVDYVIPHRIEDGYGINIKLIDDAHDAKIDTIITCDNGIAAYDQTEHAHELSMTMIITDHHEVPFEEINGEKIFKIPRADALVDPKLPDSHYPFQGICGAFVALKTIEALADLINVSGDSSFIQLKEELLEFAVLATVCDVMELKAENRTLVKIGSQLLSHSKNLGMRSLIHVTGMEDRIITPYHMGFVIGPCLNASGRLDTSLRALRLFTENDENEALKMAEELKQLNEERKNMTLLETEKAFQIVDSMEKPDDVLVVYLPNCHESLAGIIAGRVREKYVHPTFVVTQTEKGLKGSGRSIDAYDMFEKLNAPSVKSHLKKFGGHKLAAGISLENEDELKLFKEALNSDSGLLENDFYEVVKIDMELPFDYADISLARELAKLEPFGVGNEKPLFAISSVTFISGTIIGKNKNVGKYKVKDKSGRVYEMIYFGDLKALEEFVESVYDKETAEKFHSGNMINVVLGITYQIEVNSYKGNESVQLQLKHYR